MALKKLEKLEAYKKYGTRIGANANNKAFERFIFRKIPNKFTILNIKLIDERIRLAGKLLSEYKRKDILLVCTLDSAYYGVYNFAKLLKISVNFGRYLAGSLTNVEYKNFFEPKILLITDPRADRRAINDAKRMNIPVVGLANVDNKVGFLDLIIPGNNKSGNSIGLILYLLAYAMGTKSEKEKLEAVKLDDFISKELDF
ncbi:MAG: 30S ribosomal protein S2 [Candidatus Parvarchaeota archaeon]|jgi:small subunit ribosomal protein S2|nr:30S ribosomal protein S2 [Candidatus Parvarchaeota archaeon]MCL5017906.1 30S ribosomal protein S2 [Candidatus Parvarchaeota archaeon]